MLERDPRETLGSESPPKGSSLLEESLAVFRRLGDERRAATVLQDLGKVNSEFGEWEAARSVLDESLEISRRSEDEPGIALSLFYLGLLHFVRDQFPLARVRFEESLTIFRRLDDKFWINACLVHLGYVDCEEGRHDDASTRFFQMDETLPLVQFPWGATYTLEGFARLAAAEGQAARALRLGGRRPRCGGPSACRSDPSGKRPTDAPWSRRGAL